MMRQSTLAVAVALLLAVHGRAQGVDFIRGDANSDRQVTFSDAHFTLHYLFRMGAEAECFKTMDANDDSVVNLTDSIWLLNYLVLGGPSPLAPYPDPGPDPTVSGLPCADYGHGSPIEDPVAKMEILNALAPGGTDGLAAIRIAVSSSGPIAGYFGRITTEPGLFSCVGYAPMDLTWTLDSGFCGAHKGLETDTTSVRFGFLSSLVNEVSIPAGQDISVLEIYVCLAPGTPAGDYPLTLVAAELVDSGSGRSVPAFRADGVLRVLSSVVASGVSCPVSCDPPLPLRPEDVDCVFKLGSVKTRPGGSALVPFYIRANDVRGSSLVEVQGYTCSVDFDEEVLEAVRIEPLFQKPDGTAYDFMVYNLSNENSTPGNGGIDEGFVLGAVVFEFHDVSGNDLPGNTESPALSFEFRVRPDTQVASTEIRFLDGASEPHSPPIFNMMCILGQSFYPEAFNSFLFINGYVEVLPDIIAFIRGDSNADEKLDIADAVGILGYLFLGSGPPYCFDAADTDDNGDLDIGDPIYTLTYLFIGGSPPPAPFPEAGKDPTDDSMDCLTRG